MERDSKQYKSFPCTHPNCHRTFLSASGRTQHWNATHREITPASEPDPELQFTRHFHPKLNALPCDKNGNYLPLHTKPPPLVPVDATDNNAWHPFDDRLAFDFANFQFAELQASESKINRALDLWMAANLKAGGDENVPWSSAEEMYATIDAIQEGDAPWKTITFRYNGPRPANPPKWMLQTYELCTRDSRLVLHQQLATRDFADKIDYVPYRQFQADGDRIWSNLMSADWACAQADRIAVDKTTKGAMFIPVCSGSDKTTTTVGTGQQEYHPVYQSPGNLSNIARCSRGNALLPVAFLPIPKTSKRHRKKPAFQTFCRQLYHACLARIFAPLKHGMTTPEVVRCPDGHFRRAIYGLGPYIADYPEQVWLAGIVQNWCPKCTAMPENLDGPGAHCRSHEKTDFLIKSFHPDVVWSEFGIRSDVVPFTHGFPRADIHELLSPDLLHQLIKGTFKDHYVTWVNEYLFVTYGETRALEIIQDIDRRISAVPAYPGLRRFPDGRNFSQWTGDDSKALMKVYLAAISGHLPPKMVQCLASFMDLCFLFRRNAITTTDIKRIQYELDHLYQLREVFIEVGVRADISLPRQHALLHYTSGIMNFGSPNGLCSSITESKHIVAVKNPWRRSSRYKALAQMVRTINRLDKLSALHRVFVKRGMMVGTTSAYMACTLRGHPPGPIGSDHEAEDNQENNNNESDDESDNEGDDEDHDVGPVSGPRALSSVTLASRQELKYPKTLEALAMYIDQPHFPHALRKFIYTQRHPNSESHSIDVEKHVHFNGKVCVYHSAVAQFYAPSDLCGAGGMYRERIRSNPSWYHGGPRHDTIFVVLDESQAGMQGMLVARVLLFFSYYDAYLDENVPCALVNWFVPDGAEPDEATGMWVVCPEYEGRLRTVEVIHLDSIARGAHLLPVYGSGFLPEDLEYQVSLDVFSSYFVNHYVDHHAHEFLTG